MTLGFAFLQTITPFYNTISGNNITPSIEDITLSHGSSFNLISGNTINTTRYPVETLSGIFVIESSNNEIEDNHIIDDIVGVEEYEYAISIIHSSNNLISGNTVTSNFYGIKLANSSGNTISGNIVTDSYYGICLYDSSNNRFYHNNFINNTHQVLNRANASINVWDDGYPSGGNYWSDYTGVDQKSGLTKISLEAME